VPKVQIIFNGSGVPLKNGNPPANSWASYVNTITMHADANFAGGTYQWSTTSDKVTLSNTTSDTVTVTSVTKSDAQNDVPIKVTFTIEGKSVSDTKGITVQQPSSLGFVSGPSSAATDTCTGEIQTECCDSTSTGSQRNMVWQLQDQLQHSITMQIPGSDAGSYDSSHNGCQLTSFEGTPPTLKAYTESDGHWGHHYWFCTHQCACTTSGTQTYTFNGFTISQDFTYTCSSITVGGH
jgi:hypothetical protein